MDQHVPHVQKDRIVLIRKLIIILELINEKQLVLMDIQVQKDLQISINVILLVILEHLLQQNMEHVIEDVDKENI